MLSNKITKTPKQSILCWSDSALATTGFGIVSKHILQALYATGKYTIDQLGINHPNLFHDLNELPFPILPARIGNSEDVYGYQLLLDTLSRKDYDFLFIINDTYVVHEISKQALQEHIDIRIKRNKKLFKIIYYYPIDCRLVPGTGSLISMADRAVAYTNFAAQETLKEKLLATNVIYHGADIKNFHPINANERSLARKQFLGVDSDDTFVLVNVNRNGMRKDIARTILAFSEFKKQFPNSVLYLHTCMVDGPDGNFLDLRIPIQELGLNTTKDVIFPSKLHPAFGVNTETLNVVYNMADVFITTTLGEGFGLTPIESMCCGVPVIAPDNTALSELLQNRAYLYPCKERIYIDNSGYRPIGHLQDILFAMIASYSDWLLFKKNKKSKRDEILLNAQKFVKKYSWENINKQWIALFDKTEFKIKPEKPLCEKL